MASAPTETATAPTVINAPRNSWLKANAGLFAVAFALLFGAGVWGYVSSPPFAIFFMGFILFLVLFATSVALASDGNITSALLGFGFFVFSLVVLFNAVGKSLDQFEKAPTVAAASTAS